MKRSRRLAVFAGSTLALGAVAAVGITAARPGEHRAASVAGAAATTWPLVQGSPGKDTGTSLSGLAPAPDGTLWAVGNQNSTVRKPVLQRLNGGTWSNVALPASVGTYDFVAAASTSASNLWVGGLLNTSGDGHAVMHWNGTAWRTFKTPLSFQPRGIATTGADNAWAVSVLAAKHWNGTAWADTPIGIRSRAVAASSPNGVWAVGASTDGQPATARWNGTAWTTVPYPALEGNLENGEVVPTLTDVYAASDDDVWAVGVGYFRNEAGKLVTRSLLGHWDGSKWTSTVGAEGTSFTKVASDGAGGIWAYDGKGTVRHRTAAGVWTDATLTQPTGMKTTVNAMAAQPGTRTVWAVGHTTGTTGSVDLAHWRGE
ncbi:hypothetical protein AB0C84_35530 [Actinomadura sp. NPDC048955]|uniref:hypothetical protein n=1 Tax=Actinomadura sp. NPDC048955 TaxID=3158228 RepID=UPI0033C76D96